jgi:hypothetical protein
MKDMRTAQTKALGMCRMLRIEFVLYIDLNKANLKKTHKDSTTRPGKMSI